MGVCVSRELVEELQAAQEGDEYAFATLYRAITPGLIRYLTALVGSDAEDVASETWAQVCRDLSRFQGDPDGFRAWVATIGRHRALDLLRSRRRRKTEPSPMDEAALLPSIEDTAEGALESISTQQALRLIATLPREQAEVILLRVVVGLDAQSVGRVMGKRPGAVRTAAYRGLRRLADELEHAEAGSSRCDAPRRFGAEVVR